MNQIPLRNFGRKGDPNNRVMNNLSQSIPGPCLVLGLVGPCLPIWRVGLSFFWLGQVFSGWIGFWVKKSWPVPGSWIIVGQKLWPIPTHCIGWVRSGFLGQVGWPWQVYWPPKSLCRLLCPMVRVVVQRRPLVLAKALLSFLLTPTLWSFCVIHLVWGEVGMLVLSSMVALSSGSRGHLKYVQRWYLCSKSVTLGTRGGVLPLHYHLCSLDGCLCVFFFC
jgi:hypothetical protein